MKKFLSMLLCICFVFSMTTIGYAEGYESSVEFTGLENSYYEVDVPAKIKPGGTEYLRVSGVLFPSEKLTITAPDSVTITEETNNWSKDLEVTFKDTVVYGSMANSISVAPSIKVESFSVNFGTWNGIITYTVVLEETGEIPENGVYYANKTHAAYYTIDEVEVGDYSIYYLIYTNGNKFPAKPELGDVFVYDNYEYRYNFVLNDVGVWEKNTIINAWGVAEIDTEHTSEILTMIGDFSVVQ